MGNVIVNGESRQLDGPVTLEDLLDTMGIGVKWVLVEHNGEAVMREDYKATVIEPGDRLEIATPMAGG